MKNFLTLDEYNKNNDYANPNVSLYECEQWKHE